MKTIYKYPLNIDDVQTLTMPIDSVILSAVNIKEQLYVYAIIDTDLDDNEIRTFEIIGIGDKINRNNRNFLGTVIMQNGDFVAHVFEVIN